MKVLRAVGLGIFLLIISATMPGVFASFQNTAVVFMESLQNILNTAGSGYAVPTVH